MNEPTENPIGTLDSAEPVATESVRAPEAAPVASARKSVVREYAEALVIALGLAVVVRTFLFQAYFIPSGSMEPTLLIGDHIIVEKIAYGIRMPDSIFGLRIADYPRGGYLQRFADIHRGDVVVFVHPQDRDKDLIKRVVGIPGDKVQIKDGKVWLNGIQISDPHAHFEVPDRDRLPDFPRDNYGLMDATGNIVGPLEVPPGRLFVMGDNRDQSDDSRFWSFANQNDVEGRALVIYWSWDGTDGGWLPIRWARFGTSL